MDMPEHYSQESFSIDTVEDGGGQFEATLLWENIVGHLEAMKCGRHTRALRSFTNCFHGSAAVDSLLAHLSIIMAKVIKREQVQILCQKLLGTGVMEDVRNKEKDVFRESRLYKLTRNHFWSVSSINSSNQDPLENELSRAKSAEDISAEKEDDTYFQDDLDGYASDSTVSCTASRHHTRHIVKKKRSNSSRKKRSSELTLRRDAGFFQALGTKLTLNSSLMRVNSSRSISKGTDNALFSGRGESNDSLVPPETKQRRKMSSSHGQLRVPSMEENTGHSTISITRESCLDRERKNITYFQPAMRWNLEKLKENWESFPPLITVKNMEKAGEDRKGHSLSVQSGCGGSTDRLREDSRNHSSTSTRRSVDRLREVCMSPSLLDARRGSLDRPQDDNNKWSSFTSARRGTIDRVKEASLGPTRRRSIDEGPREVSTRPQVHARRRKSTGKDDSIQLRFFTKERLEEKLVQHHKPWSNSLRRKTKTSKKDKAYKMKTLIRSHSFSSLEDYMAGPSDNSTECVTVHSPPPHPLALQSGNKWIVYGYV